MPTSISDLTVELLVVIFTHVAQHIRDQCKNFAITCKSFRDTARLSRHKFSVDFDSVDEKVLFAKYLRSPGVNIQTLFARCGKFDSTLDSDSIRHLAPLRELMLNRTMIGDLTPLTNLQIARLDMIDFQPNLGQLTASLYHLELLGRNIDFPHRTSLDLGALTRFTSLKKLSLLGIEFHEDSLPELAKLAPTLENMYIANPSVQHEDKYKMIFNTVAKLTGLKTLKIEIVNQGLFDKASLTALSNLSALTALYMRMNPSDVSFEPFVHMTQLRFVQLYPSRVDCNLLKEFTLNSLSSDIVVSIEWIAFTKCNREMVEHDYYESPDDLQVPNADFLRTRLNLG